MACIFGHYLWLGTPHCLVCIEARSGTRRDQGFWGFRYFNNNMARSPGVRMGLEKCCDDLLGSGPTCMRSRSGAGLLIRSAS